MSPHNVRYFEDALTTFADQMIDVYVVPNFASPAESFGENAFVRSTQAMTTIPQKFSRTGWRQKRTRGLRPLERLVCTQYSTTQGDGRDVSTAAIHQPIACTSARDAQ
jgi:hypothetical protein